jgi:PadR family transcriptional regulator PadR
MKRQWFHILLALADAPRHGSGIVRAVLKQTGDQLRLWPATLYGSLDTLSSMGWIEEVTDAPERPEGESERKRFYRITAAGARALAEEGARLETLARAALGSPAVEEMGG